MAVATCMGRDWWHGGGIGDCGNVHGEGLVTVATSMGEGLVTVATCMGRDW